MDALLSFLKDASFPVILVLAGLYFIALGLGLKYPRGIAKAHYQLAQRIGATVVLMGMGWAFFMPVPANNPTTVNSDTGTTNSTPQPTLPGELQQITFNYEDDLRQHGWKIQRADLLTLSIKPDPQFIKFLKIESQNKSLAYLEHPIIGDAKSGTILEIVAKTDGTTSIYVRALRVDQGGQNPTEIWLKLTPRKADTAEQGREVQPGKEWEFFFVPENLNDGWQLLHVDVKKLVQDRWNSEGYQLRELKYLWLRGNLSLASITVLKE